MTWFIAVFLQVVHADIAIVETKNKHVTVLRMNVNAHNWGIGPELIFRVGWVL